MLGAIIVFIVSMVVLNVLRPFRKSSSQVTTQTRNASGTEAIMMAARIKANREASK